MTYPYTIILMQIFLYLIIGYLIYQGISYCFDRLFRTGSFIHISSDYLFGLLLFPLLMGEQSGVYVDYEFTPLMAIFLIILGIIMARFITRSEYHVDRFGEHYGLNNQPHEGDK